MRLNITARDVTNQRHVRVQKIPSDYTVGELTDELLPKMQLNRLDPGGQPIHFDVRLERDGGRHLNRTEFVGDALQDNDEVVFMPRIMAGM